MLWFSPEYFDWTISSTDDKSLAAKTRYLLAYGGMRRQLVTAGLSGATSCVLSDFA